MIIVAGVAGFIVSNFVLDWLAQCGEPVVNFDVLTYAGNQVSLQGDDPHFFLGSVGDFDRGSATRPVPARGGQFCRRFAPLTHTRSGNHARLAGIDTTRRWDSIACQTYLQGARK